MEEKIRILKERAKKLGYDYRQPIYTITIEDVLYAIARVVNPEVLSDEMLEDLIRICKKSLDWIDTMGTLEIAVKAEVK